MCKDTYFFIKNKNKAYLFKKITNIMGCGCKSNGVKKQVSQITKKTAGTSASTVNRETATPERKQIIIRRPAK
jgi:hypothetical protein